MAKIFVMRSSAGVHLIPADATAEKAIAKWKVGAAYTMETCKARNPKFHRLVFAVANLVCSNSAAWSNPHLFVKAVQLTYGFTEPMRDTHGEVFQIPRSIAFENMDEDEFKKIFECLLIEASRITGVDIDTLKREVEND